MSTPSDLVVSDEFYREDPEGLAQLRKSRPWQNDFRYFSKCMINLTAATKMLKHSIQGVMDGKSKGGMSVEVMGLLVGKPMGDQIVITDVIQLPIEGMENRIEAPAEVQVFMTRMVEIIELKRQERIVGWYHSHPFELLSYSHCHLSATDVATQTSFQSTTPWWTALVIDPIRSITEKRFEIGAYRSYPVGFFQEEGIAPDMTKWANITNMKRRWGVVPNRYYTMDITYWMSQSAAKISNRTGTYTNWTKPLLSSVFAEYLKYQHDLALVSESLALTSATLDAETTHNVLPDPAMVNALVSHHIDECRCGQLGHSRLLQQAFGAIFGLEDESTDQSSIAPSS